MEVSERHDARFCGERGLSQFCVPQCLIRTLSLRLDRKGRSSHILLAHEEVLKGSSKSFLDHDALSILRVQKTVRQLVAAFVRVVVHGAVLHAGIS